MSRFIIFRYAIDERGKAKHPTNLDGKSGSVLIRDIVDLNQTILAHVFICAYSLPVFRDIAILLMIIACVHC
jgi:hypothetical protein